MRKVCLIIILLSVLFLHLTENAFAQKTLFYDSSQDFYSSKTDFSENYSCNLDELENFKSIINKVIWRIYNFFLIIRIVNNFLLYL